MTALDERFCKMIEEDHILVFDHGTKIALMQQALEAMVPKIKFLEMESRLEKKIDDLASLYKLSNQETHAQIKELARISEHNVTNINERHNKLADINEELMRDNARRVEEAHQADLKRMAEKSWDAVILKLGGISAAVIALIEIYFRFFAPHVSK